MNYTKYIVWAVLILAVVGGYYYPPVSKSFGASPAGTTYGDAKFAGVAINLASPGANATSSSVLNSDAGTRYVSSWKIGCTGVGNSQTAYTGAGLASLQLTIGTTTTSAPANVPASTLILNAGVIGTSTTVFFQASSTVQTGSIQAAVWPAGTYMTYWFNATNTAACSIGVDYFQS